jgi:hypothetical protein
MYAKNRENMQFYNKNNRVLQEIIEAAEAGQKLGKDLVNKRIQRKKQQNIEEVGPDDDGFTKKYKEQKQQDLKTKFKPTSEIEKANAELEQKFLSRHNKPAADIDDYNAVEVGVWANDTQSKSMKYDTFFTEAEDVDQNQAGFSGNK